MGICLKEDIKNILRTYITMCVCERDDYHIPNDELVDQATEQILSLIAKNLPEEKEIPVYMCKCKTPIEKEHYAVCQKCGKLLWKYDAANQMLAEVKRKLGL